MAVCPVCQSPSARIAPPAKREAGVARGLLVVSCPTCTVPFEITGKDFNVNGTPPREVMEKRRRWAQLLREAAQRGVAKARLY